MKTIKRNKRSKIDRRNMRSNRRWSLTQSYISKLFNSQWSNNLLFSSRWLNTPSNQWWQDSISLWWANLSQWWANLSQWWCRLNQILSLWISTGMDLSTGMRLLLKLKTTSYSLLRCMCSLWLKDSQWFRHSRCQVQSSLHIRLLNQECDGIQFKKFMFELSIKGFKRTSDIHFKN